MSPANLDALRERLHAVSNTDELLELELLLGTLDEEHPVHCLAIHELHACRCRLALGPAPSADAAAIAAPPPADARASFTIRGRIGVRVVRLGWADGVLFGSRFGMRHVDSRHPALSRCDTARDYLAQCFDELLGDEELIDAA